MAFRSIQLPEVVGNNEMLVTTALVIAGAYVLSKTYNWLTISKLERNAPLLPTPPGHLPFIGLTLQILWNQNRFHDWLTECSEQFGPQPYKLYIAGLPPIVVVNTEELFEDVMKTQFENFPKGPNVNQIVGDLLGDGIFGVDGEKWYHQRKTARHLFTMKALKGTIEDAICRSVPVLNAILESSRLSGKKVVLTRLLSKFTMETFGIIGFGVDLNQLDTNDEHPLHKAFDSATSGLIYRVITPMWLWKLQRFFSIGKEGEIRRSVEVIDEFVYGIIRNSFERRNMQGVKSNESDSSNRRDLISLFLDTECMYGSKSSTLDYRFLRDIVVNFVFAGRDSTSNTLSWIFCLLAQRPDVQRKACKELVTELPDLVNGYMDAPTMEQVSNLVYLDAIIKETLRLYPQVPTNRREAIKDTFLCDGTLVPKGHAVNISSYVHGRMKHIWGEDAKEFKPERWIDEKTGKVKTETTWKFPAFHGGNRTCIGQRLANMQIKIVVASVLAKYQLKIDETREITYDMSLTLPIKGGLPVTVDKAPHAVAG